MNRNLNHWRNALACCHDTCGVHIHVPERAHQVQVNAQDTFDHTPLWDAIDRMDKEAAVILREHGASVQDGVADVLCEQAKLNNVTLFELLHAVQCDIYCRVSALCSKILCILAHITVVIFVNSS